MICKLFSILPSPVVHGVGGEGGFTTDARNAIETGILSVSLDKTYLNSKNKYMLDVNKLAKQIPVISNHFRDNANISSQKLNRAKEIFKQAEKQQKELINKQQLWRQKLIFNVGIPVESLNTRMPLIEAPYIHTVIATDGSQIAPSHHEIAYCYLINIGRIMIHYGQSKHPLLDSLPEVFYKEEDLSISRQWGIKVEEWLGYIRATSETKVLAKLAQEWRQNEHEIIPSLAMVDGTLIYWFLETLPIEAREKILNPILESWDILKELNIPIMGYISASRNSDSLNFLRFLTCPHPVPDCHTYCANQQKQPCQIFEPIKDVGLWTNQLSPGERSPLWRSTNRILELYHKEKIYFCYVNVGSEIARIEMPGWVAENQQLLNQALSLMLAQVNKGYGYPVALAEAHNLAVIRSSDRAYFFKLLEQEMIKSGLRNVGISYKETRKRGSIA